MIVLWDQDIRFEEILAIFLTASNIVEPSAQPIQTGSKIGLPENRSLGLKLDG